MTKIIDYSKRGQIFGRDLQAIIGRLLYEERWKRSLPLSRVSNKTNMKPEKIENIELARCNMHWGRIKHLLDFYGKQLVINLIDIEKKEEEPNRPPSQAGVLSPSLSGRSWKQ